jgi:hypothetical protein
MLLHRVSVLPDESLIVALLRSLIVALQGTPALCVSKTMTSTTEALALPVLEPMGGGMADVIVTITHQMHLKDTVT